MKKNIYSIKHIRSNKSLLYIFAVFFIPLTLSIILYINPNIIELGYTNNGALYNKEVNINNYEFLNNENKKFDTSTLKGKWWLLHIVGKHCSDECKNRIYNLGQMEKTLGKNNNRVNTIFLSKDTHNTSLYSNSKNFVALNTTNEDYIKNLDFNFNDDFLIIVDPLGRAVLKYKIHNTPKEILSDLKKLLKNSKIG